jgi:type IV secretion system protein TrbL
VNWLSRILTATLFVIGPLALVAGIPRVSSTGTRWFVRFVTIASWPVFSGVLLSVLVTLGAQGAVRRTYLECLVAALVMLVTALATPLLASHVIGGALDNAASHGWSSAKATQHDAVRPALRLAGGAAGRVVALGSAAAHALTGGGNSASAAAGAAAGGGGSGGGGGSRPPGGGGSSGAVSNAPGTGTSARGRSRGTRRGGAAAQPASTPTGLAPGPAEQGGVVANTPAPPQVDRPAPAARPDGANGPARGGGGKT